MWVYNLDTVHFLMISMFSFTSLSIKSQIQPCKEQLQEKFAFRAQEQFTEREKDHVRHIL